MPEFERSTHGDLFIEYNVVLPLEISPQTRHSKFRFPGSVTVLRSPKYPCCPISLRASRRDG